MTDTGQTRSALKRRAILDTAKQAFQERGVDGTSMDALAALAQVSKRTVYNHFESKEALVAHLTAELWQRAMQDIPVRFDAAAPLQPQLEAVLDAEMAVIGSPQYLDLARIALGHSFYHPEALQDAMREMAAQETAVRRWLREAVRAGALRELDLDLAADQLHGLIKGRCFWPQMLRMAEPLSAPQRAELAASAAAMFLDHYRPRAGEGA